MIEVFVADAVAWAKQYHGPKFHALLCDPPYHLTTVTKRFGKENSAPAKYGTDGAFQRASKGFMGQTWDGGDVSFRPETWLTFSNLLYEGAFGFAFAGARTYHRMATSIEQAGFIIHPMIGWVYASGMPKATKISTDHEGWAGHRYGLGTLKPALEPIVVFQKPYVGRPTTSIVATGAGALNIDRARIESSEAYVINTWDDDAHPFGGGAGHAYTSRMTTGRWPANFISNGDIDTTPFFFKTSWDLEMRDPYVFMPKASLSERSTAGGHPTVKPLNLTTYLASMLLPPDQYSPRKLFVPFAGVMSEAIGAHYAGWDEVFAVEISEEYATIGQARSQFWLKPE